MSEASETRGPCSKENRDEGFRRFKQGCESFADLLRKLADQYNPDAVTGHEQ